MTRELKRKPPPQDFMIRMLSENYSFYDAHFQAFELQKSDEKLIKFLKDSLKVNKEYYKEYTEEKPLAADYVRRVYDTKDALSLIITIHLFIETFLDEIIKRKFPNSSLILKRLEFTFSLKLDLLKSKNYLEDNMYFDIKLINTLRNKFAHNLFFDIGDFDVSKFTYCDLIYEYVNTKSKSTRRHLNLYVLRMVLHDKLDRLLKKYPFIGELDLPDVQIDKNQK